MYTVHVLHYALNVFLLSCFTDSESTFLLYTAVFRYSTKVLIPIIQYLLFLQRSICRLELISHAVDLFTTCTSVQSTVLY